MQKELAGLGPFSGKTARAAAFVGAGISLGWALHWLLLPSRQAEWLGMYSTGKLAAILGAALAGAALAWLSRRNGGADEHPERVTLLVAASLGLLLACGLGGVQLEIGTDISINLLGVDQKLHGLKSGWHTELLTTWGPGGPVVVEQPVTWYPPGPTWLFAAICLATGWAPLAVAQGLWPLLYLLNVWLLSRVLQPLAAHWPWLQGRWRSGLLAAAVLWWITACDPTRLVTADMMALPLNLAVLLGCLRLCKGGGGLQLWTLTGLAAGLIYLLKYSQYIVAATLLLVTVLWVLSARRDRRQVLGATLGLGLLLAVPAGLTWAQGGNSAVKFTVKDTLAQSEYIHRQYGENYASVTTPAFTVLGCAGGLGWNALGYGEWPRLTQWLGQAGAANFLWELLQWNRISSWCLVLGVMLTPLTWWALRWPAPRRGREGLLAAAGVLTVLMLAVVGWHKGYQWNAGLESGGRLLLPLSAVAMAVLLLAGGRSWSWGLLLGVIYIFAPWADYFETAAGPLYGGAASAPRDITSEEIAAWSRAAQSQGAGLLLVPTDDLNDIQRFDATQERMPTFGAVVPVVFLDAGRLQGLLRGTAPQNKLALVLTPAARTPETQAGCARQGIVLVTP